jgi:hypothetical protein
MGTTDEGTQEGWGAGYGFKALLSVFWICSIMGFYIVGGCGVCWEGCHFAGEECHDETILEIALGIAIFEVV